MGSGIFAGTEAGIVKIAFDGDAVMPVGDLLRHDETSFATTPA
jgi:hypothetical protein